MPEIVDLYKRAIKWMFYLLAIYVLGWGFTSYQTTFMGLILGTAGSLINLWLLFGRMKRFDKTITNGKKVRSRSLGSSSRMAVAAVAVLIAMRWPQVFQVGSMVLGLMTSYIVIMIDYLFHSYGVHKTK